MAAGYKDYYQTLGVARTATPREIKAAFRKLARKSHPDLHPDDPGAETRFKEINEAHEVLADPDKRKRYDELGPGWAGGAQMPGPFGGRGGQQVEYRTMSGEDLESLFGNRAPFSDFFHSMFGAPAGARQRQAPAVRGANVEGEVSISLEEAATGTARNVELDVGGGTRRIEVKIPAGIKDGARVRAAGQGSAGSGGGVSGDLFMRVHVEPHPVFTRSGDDLRTTVPVPLDVALLGGAVEVPTIRGTRVNLTVPPETQNGKVLRLRGLGMPRLNRSGNGDLHAEVAVRLPLPLSSEAREWAEGLRSRLTADV
jgi:DnaJ-class molecular chaperone